MEIIRKYKNIVIYFDTGSFDSFCVYIDNGKSIHPPKDVEYFQTIKELSKIYGGKVIYDDFVEIYDKTTTVINKDVLIMIDDISKTYSKHVKIMNIILTVLYAGMIAENRKENAILKKKIKRLGLYQLLIENWEPNICANFSKNKKWFILMDECKKRGF